MRSKNQSYEIPHQLEGFGLSKWGTISCRSSTSLFKFTSKLWGSWVGTLKFSWLQDTGGNDEAEDEVGDPSLEIDTLDNVPTVHRRQEKKTQTDRNRQKRQRDADLAAQEKQELKKQRRELDRVKNISQEIATLENARTAQATRKAVVKAEKALTAPPKLSKHKFQPANVQVRQSIPVVRALPIFPIDPNEDFLDHCKEHFCRQCNIASHNLGVFNLIQGVSVGFQL